MDILVLAAHPDDEVIGMGGTMYKMHKQGHKVHLCVVSDGASSENKDKTKISKIRLNDCVKSGKILGVSTFDFLNFPDMRLDSIPQVEINLKLEELIEKYNPTTVYTPPSRDFHKDHQKVYDCALVATRPNASNVRKVYSYELPGAIKTPFFPNAYENIEKELAHKIKAFKCYKTEIEQFPHPRSFLAIENLAIQRGVESGLKRAEAFQLVRSISN
jgi:LmbE family N-acetylglucosaminyl deacetylase